MLNEETLNHFKALFLEMKKDALQAANLERSLEELGDEVDLAANHLNQTMDLKLKGRSLFFLKKIDTALERIEKGTFGECTECGSEISATRLHARPTADLCIHCKEEQERGEEHVLYQKKSHTLGKEINSKTILTFPTSDADFSNHNIISTEIIH